MIPLGYDWILLDSCYIGSDRVKQNILSWREFFVCLGVRDFLCVRQQDVVVDTDVRYIFAFVFF